MSRTSPSVAPRRPRNAAPPRLPAAVRQQRILEMMDREGFVSMTRRPQRSTLSPNTALCQSGRHRPAGRLVRSHGAAVPAPAAAPSVAPDFEARELQYDTRRRRNNLAKQAIARTAAARLGPDDNVALDVGSTVLALGRELVKGPGLRVFTNHLRLASLLAGSRCEVLMPGGIVRAQELSLCGQTAVEQASQHWFTQVFIGVAGLTEDGGFDSSPEDTQVKRAYIEHTDQVILLCDSSKFGQRSLARACALDEIDVVITDRKPPASLAAALKAARVEVVVAAAV